MLQNALKTPTKRPRSWKPNRNLHSTESANDRSDEHIKHRSITADAFGAAHRQDENRSPASQQPDECVGAKGKIIPPTYAISLGAKALKIRS